MAIYHNSSNVQAAITNNMHWFTPSAPAPVIVEHAVLPGSGATGLVQLQNAAGTVFFTSGSGQSGRLNLPAGTYHLAVIGSTTNPHPFAAGHAVNIRD
jgi:streptogramin lyase